MYGPPPPQLPVPSQGPPASVPADAAAPRGRRLLAWSIDSGLLVVVAFLLGGMTWTRLQAHVAEDVTGKTWSAVSALLLSGGNVEKAATEFGAEVWGTCVSIIEQALLLLVLAELLHQVIGTAWAGRTAGKAAMDLRVRSAAADAKPARAAAVRRALVATAGGTGLYAAAWVLLLEGLFFFALLLWLAAVAVFLANSVPALAGGRRRTAADLAGGTVVQPARGYQRAAAATRQGAVRAWDGAQAVGQVAGQAAQSAGQAAGHAAHAAGDTARENAARLAQHQRVRQVAESDAARRVRDLSRRAGRQSAGKVREIATGERAQQAQDAGKRFGGRVKGAYQERRAARAAFGPQETGPEAIVPPPAGAPPEGRTPALPPPQPSYGQPAWYDPQQAPLPHAHDPYGQVPPSPPSPPSPPAPPPSPPAPPVGPPPA
ncbi:RDD family protein [Spirillospora sp. NPDC047279]|uniref:RDD family protein n=1 Tax=Spirillospora sp. NPDC047279 TaxID=3155478 RepID=UPI0033DE2A36